ncbi:21799_t:CDS:2, partial [Cetraspora pellucida]
TDCPDVLQETSDLLIFDNDQGLLGLNTNNSFSISQNDFSDDLYLSNDIEFVNTDLNEIEYQNDVLELDSEPEDEMLELEIGLSFFNLSEFKTWLNKFAKQKRFNYKVRNQFTAGVQSMQRIESINKLIHDKVDQATSLCDLLATINSCVKNKEQFEKFEIEHNVLPKVGLPSLNNRFFKE